MTEDSFVAAVLTNPVNRVVLERLPRLGLPDAWLASGALFETVWNFGTGHDPQYGIRDYDLFYFDPDTSWDAENAAIGMARDLFADVRADIEVRNQARVHLWYEEKFAMPYPPLTRATDGIDRFLMRNAQVGIARTASGYCVYAPFGFDDIEKMIVRPNHTANFNERLYLEKALKWKNLWPEVTVLPAQSPGIDPARHRPPLA